MKKKILILNKFFVPSFKSGGPVRTLDCVTQNLRDRYDFWVICGDRDSGDAEPYADVEFDKWVKVNGVNVCYLSSGVCVRLRSMFNIVRSLDFDVYYINSFWNVWFTLIPLFLRKLNLIPNKPCVLAPRGELLKGALTNKSFKKQVMLAFGKAAKLWDGLIWQYSSDEEKLLSSKSYMPQESYVLPDLSSQMLVDSENCCDLVKVSGELKICYVARIHPHKRLDALLDVLMQVEGQVILDIYGFIDSEIYWLECKSTIRCLPDNICVTYKGAISHAEVLNVYRESHLMVMLTKGENYGHSIRESLMCACPVLISDQTPWRNLALKKLGWDFPNSCHKKIKDTIQMLVDIDEKDYSALRANVYQGALQIIKGDDIHIEEYNSMFSNASNYS